MKCVYCGFESETNFIFCPNCGKEVPVDVYGDENPAASHILSVLKDKLFFVLFCSFLLFLLYYDLLVLLQQSFYSLYLMLC